MFGCGFSETGKFKFTFDPVREEREVTGPVDHYIFPISGPIEFSVISDQLTTKDFKCCLVWLFIILGRVHYLKII